MRENIKDIFKFTIKAIIFCAIALVIMYILGPIFTPKWYNKVYDN